MKVLLVYQSYGNLEGYTQTLYSILTALAFAPQERIEIHLYTDKPAAFELIQSHVHFHILTPKIIQSWRGTHDFTHRLKIMMLLNLHEQFSQNPILYLDGDTFFTQNYSPVLEQITDKSIVMHVREYFVGTHRTGQMKRFRKNMKKLTFEGCPINLNVYMWNAGVIGFLPVHVPVLRKVIEFVDEIYPKYPKHIIEQFAVSYFFQQNFTIQPSNSYITHYWNKKSEYTQAIQIFLSRYSDASAALSAIQQQGVVAPFDAPKLKWWQKWFSK
ncbi:MAG: hypothetical protein NZ519_00520 [Bacteroidia bacterium]|nr:hypothetical protein [Bacteroidia bacterium]MDW8301219.1 hypothetical protein [Bacteroidia bacterium]